eukprot:scpid53487/ scgid25765/ 
MEGVCAASVRAILDGHGRGGHHDILLPAPNAHSLTEDQRAGHSRCNDAKRQPTPLPVLNALAGILQGDGVPADCGGVRSRTGAHHGTHQPHPILAMTSSKFHHLHDTIAMTSSTYRVPCVLVAWTCVCIGVAAASSTAATPLHITPSHRRALRHHTAAHYIITPLQIRIIAVLFTVSSTVVTSVSVRCARLFCQASRDLNYPLLSLPTRE